jgi:hypothetical protein
LVIASPDWETHIQDLRTTFARAREVQLQFSLKKAQFVQESLRILGSIIHRDGSVSPDPSKTAALERMPYPKDVHEVRVFLGMINYYRHFIPNCSDMCVPLHRLLKRNAVFDFNSECVTSFEDLRNSLLSPQVLVQPDPSLPYIVATDASDYAIGAVLSQVQYGEERPIAFYSKSLNEVEGRWAAVEKELFAIVAAIKFWRQYLLGTPFILYTDCQALSWALKLNAPAGKLARWSMLLQEYSFEVIHRPGVRNQNADTFSRLPMSDRSELDI